MKKIISVILIITFVSLSAGELFNVEHQGKIPFSDEETREVFIRKDGTIYRVILNEMNDTLSVEELDIIDYEVKSPTKKLAPREIDDPQWLRNVVPYKWQIGAYGLTQGTYYGLTLSTGLTQWMNPSNNWRQNIIGFSTLSMPFIMFITPPLLLDDDIKPIAIPVIDQGYRAGPADYLIARVALSPGINMTDTDLLFSALTGYAYSWGGYYLVNRFAGNMRRAAGHFYYAGAALGYAWGALMGAYIGLLNQDQWTEDKITQVSAGMGMAYSYPLRLLGGYIGSRKDLGWRSFDSWVMAFNTSPGMLIAAEIYQNYDNETTMPLALSLAGMSSTIASGYLLRNTHFDDANAVLMILGGILGGMVGSGINIFFENEFHPALTAVGMIGGEAAVYMLRKNTIGADVKMPVNMGMNIYPTPDKGIGMNFNMSF